MTVVKVGMFDLCEAEVEGKVSSFDGYTFDIEVEVGSLKATFRVAAEKVEVNQDTWELPSYGDTVTVKLR